MLAILTFTGDVLVQGQSATILLGLGLNGLIGH
jgi:hypothetical protein